jgi:hypothetical protein
MSKFSDIDDLRKVFDLEPNDEYTYVCNEASGEFGFVLCRQYDPPLANAGFEAEIIVLDYSDPVFSYCSKLAGCTLENPDILMEMIIVLISC